MSDFLTNLVIRSFSPTPSFQPVVAPAAEPSYVEVEEESVEHIAAPKPMYKTQQEEPATEFVVDPPIITAPPPQPIRSERVESPKPEPKQKSVIPPPVETPATPVKLAPPETTPPVRPVASVNPPEPVIQPQPLKQPVMRKPANAISLPAKPSPPEPRRRELTKTRKSEPPIVEQVIEQVTEHVTQQVIERPAVRIENRREVTNHFDISNQEITSSFTTLIPKPQSQPVALPATRKSRPIQPMVQPPDETEPAAQPPETVINVAIGRIEVRATPAPNPKRERQSQGPKVMTLDDYVQQRSRGAQ
jgi:hypothetical protein